jgi:hypothetical protein
LFKAVRHTQCKILQAKHRESKNANTVFNIFPYTRREQIRFSVGAENDPAPFDDVERRRNVLGPHTELKKYVPKANESARHSHAGGNDGFCLTGTLFFGFVSVAH